MSRAKTLSSNFSIASYSEVPFTPLVRVKKPFIEEKTAQKVIRQVGRITKNGKPVSKHGVINPEYVDNKGILDEVSKIATSEAIKEDIRVRFSEALEADVHYGLRLGLKDVINESPGIVSQDDISEIARKIASTVSHRIVERVYIPNIDLVLRGDVSSSDTRIFLKNIRDALKGKDKEDVGLIGNRHTKLLKSDEVIAMVNEHLVMERGPLALQSAWGVFGGKKSTDGGDDFWKFREEFRRAIANPGPYNKNILRVISRFDMENRFIDRETRKAIFEDAISHRSDYERFFTVLDQYESSFLHGYDYLIAQQRPDGSYRYVEPSEIKVFIAGANVETGEIGLRERFIFASRNEASVSDSPWVYQVVPANEMGELERVADSRRLIDKDFIEAKGDILKGADIAVFAEKLKVAPLSAYGDLAVPGISTVLYPGQRLLRTSTGKQLEKYLSGTASSKRLKKQAWAFIKDNVLTHTGLYVRALRYDPETGEYLNKTFSVFRGFTFIGRKLAKHSRTIGILRSSLYAGAFGAFAFGPVGSIGMGVLGAVSSVGIESFRTRGASRRAERLVDIANELKKTSKTRAFESTDFVGSRKRQGIVSSAEATDLLSRRKRLVRGEEKEDYSSSLFWLFKWLAQMVLSWLISNLRHFLKIPYHQTFWDWYKDKEVTNLQHGKTMQNLRLGGMAGKAVLKALPQGLIAFGIGYLISGGSIPTALAFGSLSWFGKAVNNLVGKYSLKPAVRGKYFAGAGKNIVEASKGVQMRQTFLARLGNGLYDRSFVDLGKRWGMAEGQAVFRRIYFPIKGGTFGFIIGGFFGNPWGGFVIGSLLDYGWGWLKPSFKVWMFRFKTYLAQTRLAGLITGKWASFLNKHATIAKILNKLGFLGKTIRGLLGKIPPIFGKFFRVFGVTFDSVFRVYAAKGVYEGTFYKELKLNTAKMKSLLSGGLTWKEFFPFLGSFFMTSITFITTYIGISTIAILSFGAGAVAAFWQIFAVYAMGTFYAIVGAFIGMVIPVIFSLVIIVVIGGVFYTVFSTITNPIAPPISRDIVLSKTLVVSGNNLTGTVTVQNVSSTEIGVLSSADIFKYIPDATDCATATPIEISGTTYGTTYYTPLGGTRQNFNSLQSFPLDPANPGVTIPNILPGETFNWTFDLEGFLGSSTNGPGEAGTYWNTFNLVLANGDVSRTETFLDVNGGSTCVARFQTPCGCPSSEGDCSNIYQGCFTTGGTHPSLPAVDFPWSLGTSVNTPMSGTYTRYVKTTENCWGSSCQGYGYGVYAVVDNGTYRIIFGHLRKTSLDTVAFTNCAKDPTGKFCLNPVVSAGPSYIVKGDSVGDVNNTGYSEGSHLHYEIWSASTPVCPNNYQGGSLLDYSSPICQGQTP